MVAGVCIDCGHPVGSGKRPCPKCGCVEPMPTKARHRCVSCGSGVMSVKQPCSHCGAPDPANPGPVTPAIVRCAQCGNPTHVAAESCRKCRAPSNQFDAYTSPLQQRTAPTWSPSSSDVRPAVGPSGPSDSGASARPPSGAIDRSRAPLAAPLWDPSRTPLERRSSELNAVPRPKSEPVVAAPEAPVAAQPVGNPEDRVPCGRCGEVQPRGTKPCGRCGAPDPETAEPAPHRKPLLGLVRFPVLPVATTVVGLIALGALTWHTQQLEEEQRKQRIWLAFGARATTAKVQELEHEAQVVGVSTDALLRVRFVCLHRETLRPTTKALLQARLDAEKTGADGDVAVAEAARVACDR